LRRRMFLSNLASTSSIRKRIHISTFNRLHQISLHMLILLECLRIKPLIIVMLLDLLKLKRKRALMLFDLP
jgi:hypothetical protein